MAIRYAQEGGLVGLFPEGRVNTTDELLLPGRPGAALIALRARVPVIPCYVQGAALRRHGAGQLLHAGQCAGDDRQADRSLGILSAAKAIERSCKS